MSGLFYGSAVAYCYYEEEAAAPRRFSALGDPITGLAPLTGPCASN